jgi:NADPH:quinone reductase
MRSIRYEEFGDPARVLTLGESPRPQPRAGQVLVRMLLSPIHNHDLWTIRGSYGVKPELPAIGGSEAVGIVEAVGEGVDAALVGRRVSAGGTSGAWAEYFCASAKAAIPVPEALPNEAAAQLVAMPFSAITLLESLGAGSGDWVVQTASNGAVGKIVNVLAKSRGIRLLNLVRRAEAVSELESMGLSNVLSTERADWLEQARAIVGPQGARAAVDSVGGDVANGLCSLLGEKGRLVIFGSVSGEDLRLPPADIIFKQLTVQGFWAAKIFPTLSAADTQRMFGELIGLIGSGALKLPAGGVFGLDEACAAVNAAQTPGRAGKMMFRP